MTPQELKALRNEHDFTQTQLAGRLAVSYRTVSRWESGETPISDENADRITSALSLGRKPLDLTRATATELAMELLSRAQRWDQLEARQREASEES